MMLCLLRINMMHASSLRGARGVFVAGRDDELLLLTFS